VGIKELRETLIAETEIIVGPNFSVEVTETTNVPHSGDAKITFPNLDTETQCCKLIETCVLYIDMRRSSELSLKLKPKTVTKLYSAFVRAMTQCARYYSGHVRGIIGDRVMVLFDSAKSFEQAVNCAILMNSTAQYVINKYFKSDEVTFGIGIDAGRMLVTKTGIRKNGVEAHNYKNLVWLGRAANVASKLTDKANKPAKSEKIDRIQVVVERKLPFSTETNWTSEYFWPHQFVRQLKDTGWPEYKLIHADPDYRALYINDHWLTLEEATPAILMSELVWNGFKAAQPDDPSVTNGWFKKVKVDIPGFSGGVFGGNVIFTQFKG
jgi:class 3 adenylate cyclase